MKVKKPFYIGHPKMLAEVLEGRTQRGFGEVWAKGSLAEVTVQARERCELTGDDQIIVKVVRIVRKKPQPVIVEEVR